jgi:hypothetical protein
VSKGPGPALKRTRGRARRALKRTCRLVQGAEEDTQARAEDLGSDGRAWSATDAWAGVWWWSGGEEGKGDFFIFYKIFRFLN